MLDGDYVPVHTWKAWGRAAVLHAVAAVGGIVYGSTALNLYVPPQYEFHAQDVDAYIVATSAGHFDTAIAQLVEHVRAGLRTRSGGIHCYVSTAFHFPHANVTVTLAVNGAHIADFTRQLWPNPIRSLFPAEVVTVTDTAVEAYALSVLSLDELKHRLVATVCSLPYADGAPALPPAHNAWRIGKDGMRLQRLLELEARGQVSAQPRELALNAWADGCASPPLPRVVWATAGSVTYCMPAALTLPIASLPFATLNAQPSTTPTASPITSQTTSPACSAAETAGDADCESDRDPAVPMPPLLPPAEVMKLQACSARLERAEGRMHALAADATRRLTAHAHMRRKAAQGIARARGDWRRMRATCARDFADLGASFSALCDGMLTQWVERTRACANRAQEQYEVQLATVTARKNALLRDASESMHALETALCEKHQELVTFQRLVHEQLRACGMAVQRCALLTGAVALEDFDDMYSITLEKLCSEGVEPFVYLDAMSPADILSMQLEIAMVRAHEIHSGHWDYAPPVKHAVLRGVDCEGWKTVSPLPTVEAQRANLLAGVKESFLALCLSPPLRRLRDIALLVDNVLAHSVTAASTVRDAYVPERPDFTLIRLSHAVRVKCGGEIHR
jgi:hypothetical protein